MIVDDLLAKSKTKEQHPKVIIKVFDQFLEHNVRLNPKKCVFRVTSWKLLDFIVPRWGIDVDSNKIKSIVNMPSP